ncbi:MAG: T9SS type A sorting domain-containing protein, partial [Melioribacteraceae bacterium]|nr:T9SS type A sorting domain-containing protein [Melioribacteraceae bacterium]
THSNETGMYDRFITISHLPQRAVIRIFNLAGQLVKKIEKNSTFQFLRWDLRVDSGLQIGPGVYIAHIEMPDLGKTKILKFSVIHEQFIPDRF